MMTDFGVSIVDKLASELSAHRQELRRVRHGVQVAYEEQLRELTTEIDRVEGALANLREEAARQAPGAPPVRRVGARRRVVELLREGGPTPAAELARKLLEEGLSGSMPSARSSLLAAEGSRVIRRVGERPVIYDLA